MAAVNARLEIDDALYRYSGHFGPPPVELPPPTYIEHPVNHELQPDESALLGGAIELRASWNREQPNDDHP